MVSSHFVFIKLNQVVRFKKNLITNDSFTVTKMKCLRDIHKITTLREPILVHGPLYVLYKQIFIFCPLPHRLPRLNGLY